MSEMMFSSSKGDIILSSKEQNFRKVVMTQLRVVYYQPALILGNNPSPGSVKPLSASQVPTTSDAMYSEMLRLFQHPCLDPTVAPADRALYLLTSHPNRMDRVEYSPWCLSLGHAFASAGSFSKQELHCPV